MTQRDKWLDPPRPRVARYFAYREILKVFNIEIPPNVKLVELDFVIPMPKSWSKKKKTEMLEQLHRQKPDIDNLIKAFLDSICGDDAYVPAVLACKSWGNEGSIEVKVHANG